MAASTAQTTEAAGPAAASRTATTQVRFAATVNLRQTLHPVYACAGSHVTSASQWNIRARQTGRLHRLVFAEKRIAYRQQRKAAEISVRSPKLSDPVGKAKGGDFGIVNHRPQDPARRQLALQSCPVRVGLGQQSGHRRPEPCIDLGGGLRHRRRRVVDPRMRHDCQEFMHTRPGKAPKHTARRQPLHAGAGLGMPLGVVPVGIDKDIRVDGDQPPRPS